MIIGQYSDRGTIPIKPHFITMRALQLIGSAQGITSDLWDVMKFMESIPEKHNTIKDMITHRFPLERASEAIDAVRSKEAVKVMVVPGSP